MKDRVEFTAPHGKKRRLAAAAMMVLVSGCLVGPDYRRPVVIVPDFFRGSPAASASDAQSIADLKWFEIFEDEQLRELIRAALAQNRDLRDAVARVDAARANLRIVQADQYPNIGAGADVTVLEASRRGQQTIPRGIDRERSFTTVFASLLTFEIDIWGRLRRATEAARAELLAADWNRKVVITTLTSDVVTAYFNLLGLDVEREIASNTLSVREESLHLIGIQQRGGAATLLDVRQAEQLVYTAKQVVFEAERLIEQTENLISLLLGRNPGVIPRGARLMDQEQPPLVPPGLPSALLERRPDIQAAEHILITANANIAVARAAYFPQITLTGEFGFQSTALSNLFSGSRRLWTFVPQLTQPVFTAGRITSGVEFAEAQQRSALAQYEKAIQAAFRETSDSLVQYHKVREIRAQRELLVNALMDRKRLAYLRYRSGVDTMLNALNADQDLFVAELSLAQARRDELVSLVQLYKALGGGWQ
jgi:multidrug efflux system outer membrane protein